MYEPACLVVALCGLPGAGKSTLARSLLETLPLRGINRDAIRAAQFPLCAYSDDEKQAANRAVEAAIVANCRLGFSSLVDGMTLASRAGRSGLERVAISEGARFALLHLRCPVDVARKRVGASAHAAGDRNAALVDAVAERFDPPGDTALSLDATLAPETVATLGVEAVAGLLDSIR